MKIILPFNDFLEELFPVYKESGRDLDVLKRELQNYYSYGPYEPTVTIHKEWVEVNIDTTVIFSQEKDYSKAVSLCEQGKYNQAKPILQKLIGKNPTNSEYLRIMGQILSDQGDQDAAIDSLIEALRWNPQNGYALIMMGNIFAKFKDDIQTAKIYYDQAIRTNPKDSIAVNNVAATLMQKGNITEAKNYFLKALKINPDYPNTHFGLGMIYEMEGDLITAFESMLKAINLNNKKDALYKKSLQQVFDVAKKYVEQKGVGGIVEEYLKKLEIIGGFNIEVAEDNSIPTAAKMEYAENYDRKNHLIKYKPNYPAVEHLIIHELVHLELAVEARNKNVNQIFLSTQQNKREFISTHKASYEKMKRSGIDEESLSRFFNEMFDGINLQAYNTPIDLFIEQRIYDRFPSLRPYQFISIYILLIEGVKGVTDNRIVDLAPRSIVSSSKIYNLINALQFKDLYALDMTADFKPSKKEINEAEEMYKEYLQYKDDKKPGEEYELVQNWASDLGLDSNFELMEEENYRNERSDIDNIVTAIEEDPWDLKTTDPRKEKEMKAFQERAKELGTNMAVVMYMVDALSYFDGKPKEKIKDIAFEIAMLGRQGFSPDKKGYKLNLIPHKSFSGYHILAYYYVSWKLAIPDMVDNLELPYDQEYKLALTMHKPKSNE